MRNAREAEVPSEAPVLVVDLDGTLIKTDLLIETTLVFLKRSPLSLPLLAIWLARGKAHLKEQIAERAQIDAVSLPYNSEFLGFLRAEHAAGRRTWLATASDRRPAEPVAAHPGLFDRVPATENGRRPSEQELQILANCYLKQKDNSGYVSAIEKLVIFYPKKEYWSIFLAQLPRKSGFSDRFSLDVLRLKMATGTLSKTFLTAL